jgi:hypothetical protein
MNTTDIESKLKSTVAWTLQEIDTVAHEITAEAKLEWPTIKDLVVSGALVNYLKKLLTIIIPLLDYAKLAFPQYAVLISWIESILTDIKNVSQLLPA